MPPLTIGVEEEFHLVDLESKASAPLAEKVLRRLDDDAVVPELKQSVVETNSAVCTDLSELRDDLARLRRELIDAASDAGAGLVASGSVPLVGDDATQPFPKDRYVEMSRRYHSAEAQQVVCGLQTQVGVADRDLAVRLLTAAMPWTPVLTALAGSSPYWFGTDTGYASYRTTVWDRWPTSGPPAPLDSAAAYDELVDALVRTETVLDRGMIYFDIRLSAHQPTVEFRVCDSTANLDQVVGIAGLWRGLAATCLAELGSGTVARPPRIELVRAARWRAARDGLRGRLLDPLNGEFRAAADVVERLLDYVTPALSETGDLTVVSDVVATLLDVSGAAEEQRRVHAIRGSLTDVVDHLMAATQQL